MSSTPKVWFITGSSSGFGRSMVELLLNKGNKVVATLRNPDASQTLPPNTPLPNSSSPSERSTLSSTMRVRPRWERSKAVPEEAARSVFEVNFWGAANVTKEAVRFFRDVNTPPGGRLLQVSSQVGIAGAPAVGFYSASSQVRILVQFLEGLSECLSTELDPAWNIKVTIIEPGPFRTKIVTENMKSAPQLPAYADPQSPSSQIRAYFSPESGAVDGDADKAVAAMEKLAHLDNPPLRLPLHKWTVAAIKEKIQKVLEEVQAYESWSNDLYIN
ncbi:hypothetical protein BU15DRAFT_81565 [Melanogaster broomeanus]|nr:hypothetical protein BU15DRAFT_81565 [Melanogaster broomeanus]